VQAERRKKELVIFLSRGEAYILSKTKLVQAERRKKELVHFLPEAKPKITNQTPENKFFLEFSYFNKF